MAFQGINKVKTSEQPINKEVVEDKNRNYYKSKVFNILKTYGFDRDDCIKLTNEIDKIYEWIII